MVVLARTLDGEIGVMAGHIPLLGVLAEDGEVRIRTGAGDDVTAKVSGGFLSVTNDGVSVSPSAPSSGAERSASVRRPAARARRRPDWRCARE